MTTFDFSPLFRSTVGFDRMQRMLEAAIEGFWKSADAQAWKTDSLLKMMQEACTMLNVNTAKALASNSKEQLNQPRTRRGQGSRAQTSLNGSPTTADPGSRHATQLKPKTLNPKPRFAVVMHAI